MIHFECFTCHMEATIVGTETGKLAWLDHMRVHAVPEGYGMWTWKAIQAPGPDELPS